MSKLPLGLAVFIWTPTLHNSIRFPTFAVQTVRCHHWNGQVGFDPFGNLALPSPIYRRGKVHLEPLQEFFLKFSTNFSPFQALSSRTLKMSKSSKSLVKSLGEKIMGKGSSSK